jgi:hypothetical protein
MGDKGLDDEIVNYDPDEDILNTSRRNDVPGGMYGIELADRIMKWNKGVLPQESISIDAFDKQKYSEEVRARGLARGEPYTNLGHKLNLMIEQGYTMHSVKGARPKPLYALDGRHQIALHKQFYID